MTVEAGQAGGAVTCTCGNRLDVPTLRNLAKLTPAGDSAAVAQSQPATSAGWGVRQGLILLACVTLTCALGATFYIWYTRPPPILELFDRNNVVARELARIDQMSVIETWSFWKIQILEGGFGSRTPPKILAYNRMAELHHRKYYVAGFATVVGLLILIAGLCWQKPQPVGGRSSKH